MPGKKIPQDRRRGQILEAAYRVALRDRLGGLSSRAVAAEAGVSNGLVFFHFRNRQALLLALLDWLLEQTILRQAAERHAEPGRAAAQLAAEVRNAVSLLARDRGRIELFFDYWFMGARDTAIRRRIRAALKRYRDSYVPLARAAVQERPAAFAGVAPEALAAVVTGYIEGCALEAIADPRRFDVEALSGAMTALLAAPPGGSLAPAAVPEARS
jgi:AcrR family transcriptional regulator